MGGTPSKPNLNVELASQSESPLVAVNKRFCIAETTRLRFESHTGHSNFKVVDLATRKQQFQISDHSFSTHDRKTVYDKNNIPLATLQRGSGLGNFLAVDASTEKDLFKIESHSDILFIDIAARITNPDTGDKFKVEVTGNWNQRKVLVWLIRGSERVPVGRITKYGTYYDVEVAPGVDAALIVLLLSVFHEGTA